MPPPAGRRWNPELYQASHSFVWELGRELIGLLEPRPGERVLDAGCGTGELTAEIARLGARVTGIDSSPEMVEQARRSFPDLEFAVADATALPYREEFDAVFSNAVLHWVKDADSAAAGIARALKPGGRFAAELGGRGNIETLLGIVYETLRAMGVARPRELCPWYFPSVGGYASVLERSGLLVTAAALFDRPTPLEGGEQALDNWLAMFGGCFSEPLETGRRDEFLSGVRERARATLLRDGVWTVDYRRLRITAIKE